MKQTYKKIIAIAPTALLGLAIFTAAAYAATFSQPTGTAPQGNPSTPLNIGSQNQVKSGNLSVAQLIGSTKLEGQNEVCIGDDCRSAWPTGSSGAFSTECKINTLLIVDADGNVDTPHANNASGNNKFGLGARCFNYLSAEEKEEWVLAGFDNCPGVADADCAGASYCKFVSFECGEGITFEAGTLQRVDARALVYQCSDGIDNDNDGLIDYGPSHRSDPGCSSPTDNTEAGDSPGGGSNSNQNTN